MKDREQWLKWAIELQSLSQAGLNYAKDVFDVERYTRIREISAEIVAHKGDIPVEKVKNLFCNEVGYQTPKIDCRAAVFKEDRVLMVKERDGKWSLPGGWVDVDQSVADNTVKEVLEEAGINVTAEKIIAVQDGVKNIETSERGYFEIDNLPELSEIRNTEKQIRMCFEAYKSDVWEALFD